MLAETHKKQISNLLFIIWAGGAALFSYALVYALRKPFTAATFDGLEFMGMDYKRRRASYRLPATCCPNFWVSNLSPS